MIGRLDRSGDYEKLNGLYRLNMESNKVLLHIGCADRYFEGFINSDKYTVSPKGSSYRLDKVMDIARPWPYDNESVDGIVSMHVLQQLTWRELVIAFREAYRVLKKGGVMRFGCPMIEIVDKDLDYILGWRNINLFSFDLLKRVLVDRIGFSHFRERGYQRSRMPELAQVDNRPDRGTLYFEVVK
jgi:SAM-dependent methyltransferase